MKSLRKPNKKFAHELIAKTAEEFAGAWYEEAAHDDTFYHYYPSQKMFIKREYWRFIDTAKQQLALMLGREDVAEWEKEQIFDALVKHASLPGNMDRRVVARELDPNIVH